jgi:hypothetical protein
MKGKILMKKFLLVSILLITITLGWFTVINCNTKMQLEKIIEFDKDLYGYATLTNSDLMFWNLSNGKGKRWVEWKRGGKTLKRIDNAGGCKCSLDGKYYAYLNLSDERNKAICINNDNNETIAVFELGKYGADFFWAFNSKYLFIKKRENNSETILYKYNIFEKTSEKILDLSIYFAPVIVEDEKVIYLLKIKDNTESDIVRYDLSNKKFKTLSFPSIPKLWIFDYYTVSPNGKILVFQNCHNEDSAMYIINLENSKIIDRVSVPEGGLISDYSWKPDSSHFVFTTDMKVVYKYTIPKY